VGIVGRLHAHVCMDDLQLQYKYVTQAAAANIAGYSVIGVGRGPYMRNGRRRRLLQL
jgi:hypothetical protein